MSRIIIAISFLLIPCVVLGAPKTMDEYNAIYNREMAKIEASDFGKAMADASYQKALERAKVTASQEADVATVKAVIAELERFENYKDLETAMPEETPKPIARAQDNYEAELATCASRRRAQVLALSQQYLSGLKGLTSQLLSRNKLEEAQKVADEMKKVEFVIADLSAQTAAGASQSTPSTESRPLALHASDHSGLRRSLILQYEFDEDTTAGIRDLSGSGNDGTIVGAKLVDDPKGGKYCSCPGYVQVGNNKFLDGARAFTIFMRFLPNPSSSGWKQLIGSGDKRPGQDPISMQFSGNTMSSFCFTDTKGKRVLRCDEEDNINVMPNEWHTLCAVVGIKGYLLYIDEKLISKQRRPGGFTLSYDKPMPTQVGAIAGGQGYSGGIDSLLVWARALDNNEIKQVHDLVSKHAFPSGK